MMPLWLAVAGGGALGSLARHAVNVFISRVVSHGVPYATAAVNISGCAAIGVLAGMVATGQLRMGTPMRGFVFVGVLGGFTTFSSFGLDTLTLVREGQRLGALGNVFLQVVIGIAAVFAGYAVASSRAPF